jgi:ubiquinone/menaquinone biosynthesis C-methylase UbiE
MKKTNVEKHNKEMYNQFGKEYQKSRDEKSKSRLYNEYLEVPCMLKAVGKIKRKKLLDVGCGGGVHIKHYLKTGAKCSGIDLSDTMIELAKKNCPNADFKVGSMLKLPYKSNSFDIITCSLAIDYVENLDKVLKEMSRVLKKGGRVYYSTGSPIYLAKERYEDENYKITGIGEFKNKKSGKYIILGNAWKERLAEWEMLPGMLLKTFKRTLRTNLESLRKAGFELVDFIDCKPSPEFKKYDAEEYKVVTKFPAFSIYVGRKK